MRIIGNDPNKPRQTAATASGTLPNGKPVVVNSDGTVSAVSETEVAEVVGSAVIFEDASTQDIAATFDSTNNKVVFAYMDRGNSDYGTAVVGTVSGTSISFGTPVVFNSASSTYIETGFDENAGKALMVYRDAGSSYHGKAIVGTVSGTSISFGTEATFNAAESQSMGVVYEPTAQKMVISYRDEGNSNYGTAIVGTISGTSISFGSEAVFESASTADTQLTYDASAGKVVVAYRDTTNSNTGTAAVGTVSGTSISFGTPVVFNAGASVTSNIDIAYDSSAQKVVICFKDGNNSNYGRAIVGTVSGTSISFGSPVTFLAGTAEFQNIVYDSAAQKIVIVYEDTSNTEYGTVISGTVSGTSITFDTAAVFESAEVEYTVATYDSNAEKVVIAYRDSANTNKGTSVVYQPAYTSRNLTAENYIGMSGGVLEDTEQSESVGSSAIFLSGETSRTATTYDPSQDKIVVAYRDNGNGNYGTVAVGTVTGSSISFGTPVVFKTATVAVMQASYDSANNKIVIAYRDGGNGNYGTAIVGTVSGTSISFGTPVVFQSAASTGFDIAFDSSTDQNVISYVNSATGQSAVILGTVSGTSISFGSATTVTGANATNVAYDTANNKVVLSVYATSGSPNDGIAYVGTVSGTSISFGSGVTYKTNVNAATGCVFDASTGKIVVGYGDGGTNDMRCKVGTVSGTSISFGSEINVGQSAGSGNGSLNLDTSVNKVVYSYRDNASPYKGVLRAGSISGTSITFDTEFTFETGETTTISSGFDSTSRKMIISYSESGGAQYYGKSVAYQPAGSYQSRGEVSDGGNAVVDVQGGISDIQENLTAGQSYYVQTDGTISTTAGDPSVFAGTAVSSTKLIVKG